MISFLSLNVPANVNFLVWIFLKIYWCTTVFLYIHTFTVKLASCRLPQYSSQTLLEILSHTLYGRKDLTPTSNTTMRWRRMSSSSMQCWGYLNIFPSDLTIRFHLLSPTLYILGRSKLRQIYYSFLSCLWIVLL